MERVSRKSFISAAAGAAVGVGGFLYPGLSRAATPDRHDLTNRGTISGPDPTFASGEVVTKTDASVLLQTEVTARVVRIQPGPTVWKEFDVTINEIQIGDWVDAKGTPQVDGSLAARPGWAWVNIGRTDGVITSADGAGVVVAHSHGSRRLTFSSTLEVIHRDETPVSGHTAALTPGTTIGAVGLRLSNGDIRATRIWLAG